MPQIIITIVFGFLWWWVFNHVGPGLTYLMILGSVLAVCVCCCKGGEPQWGWWSFNWDGYVPLGGTVCSVARYGILFFGAGSKSRICTCKPVCN